MNILHWHLFGGRPGMSVLLFTLVWGGCSTWNLLCLSPALLCLPIPRVRKARALPGGVRGGVGSFLTLSPSHWPWAKTIRWAFGKHDHDLLWGSMDRLNRLLKTVSVGRTPSRESWAPGLRSSSAITRLWDPTSLPCTSSVLWWNKADI